MVPKYTEFYLPVLEALSDVENKDINALMDTVASLTNLSEEDKLITTRKGNQLQYRSNISWAVTDLAQGGFIERTGRGSYVITMSGLELLEEKPINPNRKTLAAKSEQFREFLNRRGTRKKTNDDNLSLFDNGNTKEFQNSREIKTITGSDATEGNLEIMDSTGVSLKELYQTLSILKKANLSTVEIEARISQLEKESVVNKYKKQLVKILDSIAVLLGNQYPLLIDFRQNHSLTIDKGKTHLSFNLDNIVTTVQIQNNVCNNTESKSTHGELRSRYNIEYVNDTTKNPIGLSKKNSDNSINNHNNKSFAVKSNGIWFKPYSDRSFAIYGDTEPFTELLKSYGGYNCKHIKEGNCWVFFNGKREGLEKDLKEFIIPEPKSQKLKTKNSTEIELSRPKPLEASDRELTDKEKTLLAKYTEKLSNLRYFNFLGVSGPHKAILLISIFHLIKKRHIIDPKIYYSEDIEARYNYNWNILVGGTPSLGASYPFVHLGQDGIFRHTFFKEIKNYDKTWNKQILKRHIEYTVIDTQLFNILQNNKINEELSSFLIERYCKNSNSPDIRNYALKKNLSKGNQRDGFINYLENYSSKKNGQKYSKGSIKLYASSFNNPLIREIVEEFDDSGDIFNVVDLNALQLILAEVNLAIGKKLIPYVHKTAISHYIDYILSTRVRDKHMANQAQESGRIQSGGQIEVA